MRRRWCSRARRTVDQQLVDLERLLQVVERPELHRLDGVSTVACAVIITICGRSPSGIDADEVADQLEAGHARASGCRRRARRTTASVSSRRASRAFGGSTTSWPSVAQRAAERLENLLLVVDEEDGARGGHDAGGSERACSGSSISIVGAVAAAVRTTRGPAESLDDVPCDWQAEAGAGAPGGEVGLEDVGQVRRPDAGAAVAHLHRTRSDPVRSSRSSTSAPVVPTGGLGSAAARARRTACRALASRLTSAVRSRSASVTTSTGVRRQSTSTTAGPPPPADAASAASRQTCARSAGSSENDRRPREVEHVVDDAVRGARPRRRCRRRPRRSPAAARPGRSVRSDALMIISGLRTSCAITVDSRPSESSRSRCAASRWKRAIESVSVLKVVASSRASSSSQWPARAA